MKSIFLRLSIILLLSLSACAPAGLAPAPDDLNPTAQPSSAAPTQNVTAIPTREAYQPGQLVDYTVQTGDSLTALAVRFNTSEDEIRAANPIIPKEVTTLPPGMPMKIPIYYQTLWGSSYHILPDELFVNGPAQVDFNTADFINAHAGWLKDYQEYASGNTQTAAQIIDLVATEWSISPRLLLALVEYQAGGLSRINPPDNVHDLTLGITDDKSYTGLYLQLVQAANGLNNSYYNYRVGKLTSFNHLDGTMERPDPWQNAASVAIQIFFAKQMSADDYALATSPHGISQTYQGLFGKYAAPSAPLIPGSLIQPTFQLPFQPDKIWAFTGGPHTGWGEGAPLAAIDFAPPSGASGCIPSDEWGTAVADGVIARAEEGLAILDLDGDGDERTGWSVLYLHVILDPSIVKGKHVRAGDIIGHPSCERGRATGTHVHIARKYNGEWMPADGAVPFDLEGWVVHAGSDVYVGTLTRFGETLTACTCSDKGSMLETGK